MNIEFLSNSVSSLQMFFLDEMTQRNALKFAIIKIYIRFFFEVVFKNCIVNNILLLLLQAKSLNDPYLKQL